MPRTPVHGEPEGEDVPVRDRPYESFGQQGYAMPDHVTDPHDDRRGSVTISLGRPAGPARSFHRADDRIKDDVCRRLTEDSHVDASDIEVVVRDAEVFLSGTTTDRWQRRRAEGLAEHVRGVIDVMNRIRVRGP